MDQETKTEIWETFKDKFVAEGINSPDELSIQTEKPSEETIVKEHAVFKLLGRIKNFAVWLYKSAREVCLIIITIAVLPNAIDTIKIRYPSNFEAAREIGQSIKSYQQNPSPLQLKNFDNEYIVFNDAWMTDRTQYDKDTKALDATGYVSANSVIAPKTAADPEVIILTNISDTTSDMT